jgi:drug/metabolite transporter (DMT)-like permease
MTVACAVTFLQFLLTHPLSALRLPREIYALTLAMAIFSTVLPAALMSEGLRRIGANQAAMVGSIGPVSTILLGYVFLGEVLTGMQLAGAVLVLAGVTLVTLKSKVTPS